MNEFLRLRVRVLGLVTAAGILACLCTLTGFAGRAWWIFDLTSHFRLQYAVCLFLTAGAFGLAKKMKPALLFIGFAALNCVVFVPHCWFGAATGKPTGRTLRVVLMNVRTENQRYDLVESFIRENSPDLIVIEETNQRWLEKLATLRDVYPHSRCEAREDNFGIALFSKLPLETSDIVYFGSAEVPSVVGVLQIDNKKLTVLGTHPLPPGSRENTSLRDEQLSAVSEFVKQRTNSVILLGDLNTTPWSHTFNQLSRKAGLIDTGRGFGFQATWPTDFFPMRIPIDHCLVSPDIKVISRKVGRDIGSDHFPLLVEIAVAP